MIKLEFKDKVACLTLQRPPVNALNNQLIKSIDSAIDEVASRVDITVLHIRSSEKVFCAGADLEQVRAHFSSVDGPTAMVNDIRNFHKVFDRLEHLNCVTVAEISGSALGGGLELALACDLRIAAIDACLGLPETKLGLIPGAGGTQRLTRLCGPGVAARIILTAEIVNGTEAERLGLVQWAVPSNDVSALTAKLVLEIAKNSAAAAAVSKQCIARVNALKRVDYEAELQGTYQLMQIEDTRTRVNEFFNRKKASVN